jgi:exopolysaccharide biosynthesis polyprenyl glycosylphosphotransferase
MLHDYIKKYKSVVIFLGDIGVFFVSLLLMIAIRYKPANITSEFHIHTVPFTATLIVWLLVFYIADLYTHTTWRTTLENAKLFSLALTINVIISITIFYLFGSFFKLTPKLNLIIFTGIFALLDGAWRFFLTRILSLKNQTHQIIIIAESPLVHDIQSFCKKYPELGYHIDVYTSATEAIAKIQEIKKATIVIGNSFLKNAELGKILYKQLNEKIQIETLAHFYGRIFGRIPLTEVTEEWFIQEVHAKNNTYLFIKRMADVFLALFACILFSPIALFLLIVIPLSSRGSALYTQIRTGKDSKNFTLYKFRTMYEEKNKNPDQSGSAPAWAQQNDPRITRFGKVLRATHLDELPQLINIIIGDMSFVGPRPERPEFAQTLKEEIPHYLVRHTVLPGLTGWAQIKFKYASSVTDWKQKFEYDLYYIQNQNMLTDMSVIVKTIRFLFTS